VDDPVDVETLLLVELVDVAAERVERVVGDADESDDARNTVSMILTASAHIQGTTRQ
jgi:hypothetical protein